MVIKNGGTLPPLTKVGELLLPHPPRPMPLICLLSHCSCSLTSFPSIFFPHLLVHSLWAYKETNILNSYYLFIHLFLQFTQYLLFIHSFIIYSFILSLVRSSSIFFHSFIPPPPLSLLNMVFNRSAYTQAIWRDFVSKQ